MKMKAKIPLSIGKGEQKQELGIGDYFEIEADQARAFVSGGYASYAKEELKLKPKPKAEKPESKPAHKAEEKGKA